MTLADNDIRVRGLALCVELSTCGALHTVVGPHDLLDACVRQNDRFEQFRPRVVRLEGAVILRVPIPREKYMLVSRFVGLLSPQFFDDGEDFLVVGYTEGASCAEVILHVDHYQSSDFLILLCLCHIFFRRQVLFCCGCALFTIAATHKECF